MADSHPKNLDPRPKRRRDEENPYEIYTAGINTALPHFYLFFKGCDGVKRWMEIDKTLFDAFNEADWQMSIRPGQIFKPTTMYPSARGRNYTRTSPHRHLPLPPKVSSPAVQSAFCVVAPW